MKIPSTEKERLYVGSAFENPSVKTLLMEALYKKSSVQDIIQIDEEEYVIIYLDGSEDRRCF